METARRSNPGHSPLLDALASLFSAPVRGVMADCHCVAVSTGANPCDTIESAFLQESVLGRAAAGTLQLRRAKNA
jgi:hypothetical protein